VKHFPFFFYISNPKKTVEKKTYIIIIVNPPEISNSSFFSTNTLQISMKRKRQDSSDEEDCCNRHKRRKRFRSRPQRRRMNQHIDLLPEIDDDRHRHLQYEEGDEDQENNENVFEYNSNNNCEDNFPNLLDDDDEEEDLILPCELTDDEDENCRICNQGISCTGSVSLSKKVRRKCNKIISDGLNRNNINPSIKRVTEYVNKKIIDHHNNFVQRHGRNNISRIERWNEEEVKKHYTKCIGNVETRSLKNMMTLQHLIRNLVKYDLVYTRNDGPTDARTGKRIRVKHIRKDVARLTASLIKEFTRMDIQLAKLFRKDKRRNSAMTVNI